MPRIRVSPEDVQRIVADAGATTVRFAYSPTVVRKIDYMMKHFAGFLHMCDGTITEAEHLASLRTRTGGFWTSVDDDRLQQYLIAFLRTMVLENGAIAYKSMLEYIETLRQGYQHYSQREFSARVLQTLKATTKHDAWDSGAPRPRREDVGRRNKAEHDIELFHADTTSSDSGDGDGDSGGAASTADAGTEGEKCNEKLKNKKRQAESPAAAHGPKRAARRQ